MRLELVSIPTLTLPFDGLYYEPDGDHFYNGREDAVIEAVTFWRYING